MVASSPSSSVSSDLLDVFQDSHEISDNLDRIAALEDNDAHDERISSLDVQHESPTIIVLGPTLMTASGTLLAIPCLMALSSYTIFCIILFGTGAVVTCFATTRAMTNKMRRMELKAVQFLENFVLDDFLLQTIQTGNQTIVSMASIIAMYSLPLTRQCRMEFVSAIVPKWCLNHGFECTQTKCERISVAQVLTKQGGLLALSPKYREKAIRRFNGAHKTLTCNDLTVSKRNEHEESSVEMMESPLSTTSSHVDQSTLAAAIWHAGGECISHWFSPLYLGLGRQLQQKMGSIAFAFALICLRKNTRTKNMILKILQTLARQTVACPKSSFWTGMATTIIYVCAKWFQTSRSQVTKSPSIQFLTDPTSELRGEDKRKIEPRSTSFQRRLTEFLRFMRSNLSSQKATLAVLVSLLVLAQRRRHVLKR